MPNLGLNFAHVGAVNSTIIVATDTTKDSPYEANIPFGNHPKTRWNFSIQRNAHWNIISNYNLGTKSAWEKTI